MHGSSKTPNKVQPFMDKRYSKYNVQPDSLKQKLMMSLINTAGQANNLSSSPNKKVVFVSPMRSKAGSKRQVSSIKNTIDYKNKNLYINANDSSYEAENSTIEASSRKNLSTLEERYIVILICVGLADTGDLATGFFPIICTGQTTRCSSNQFS